MKNFSENNIVHSLNNSLNNIKDDLFMDIKASIRKEKVWMKKGKLWGLFGGTIVFVILLIGIFTNYNNSKISALISIDVNPSITLKVNQKNKVMDVKAINDGAKQILNSMDLKGIKLDIAINALIGSMLKHGYLTNDDANILVSVESLNKDNELKDSVVSIIDKSLTDSKIVANIIKQDIDKEDEQVLTKAKENSISYGKSLFISELIKKDNTLVYEDLAKMSLRSIAKIIDNKSINISDIVEYDDDDNTLELIDDKIEDLNEEKDVIPSNGETYLTKDEIKDIVFKHANISSNDVKNIAIKFDFDDNNYIYEVDFRTDNKEYEYDVNAYTGKIIDYETENIKVIKDNSSYITESKAKEIAYKHANVLESDIRLLKVVLDDEDGIKVYDIEFMIDDYEYEYEINALTGEIIDFDKEIDD